MVFNKVNTFYVIYLCFSSYAFSQNFAENVVLVEQNINGIKVYKSNGFVDRASVKKNIENQEFINLESNDITYLRDDELQTAFSHARLKLDRAVLFFDQADIERYTQFLNRIVDRLKQLGEL